MRVSEIAPYLDLEKIEINTLKHLLQALIRWEHPGRDHEWLYQQYGDEAADLELALKRANLAKTMADIRQTDAETKLAQIDADDYQRQRGATGGIMSGIAR